MWKRMGIINWQREASNQALLRGHSLRNRAAWNHKLAEGAEEQHIVAERHRCITCAPLNLIHKLNIRPILQRLPRHPRTTRLPSVKDILESVVSG